MVIMVMMIKITTTSSTITTTTTTKCFWNKIFHSEIEEIIGAFYRIKKIVEIRGCHGDDYEDSCLLECDVVRFPNFSTLYQTTRIHIPEESNLERK
jgi:hypothetical protein